MEIFTDTLTGLLDTSGLMAMTWQNAVMILLSFVLFYLAIVKQYEPLLMLPIAFGMLLTNLPLTGLYHPELWDPATNPYFAPEYLDSGYVDGSMNTIFMSVFTQHTSLDYGRVLHDGGLLDMLYLGVKLQIYPPLIFLGIGAMTDFGPLIANPKSFLLGAAAQGGIFFTFIGACLLNVTGIADFTLKEAASIAIIGGADGPTAIYLTSKLAPQLLGSIAVAAYSYMALVPVIQPPIMRLLTTKNERAVRMGQLREVSKLEKVVFPIAVTVIVSLIVPSAAPLVGILMFGNLMKESGVCDRLVKTATNELMNIITIFLGITVGATAVAENFLSWKTIFIIVLGLVAFCIGTACGVLLGKLMYLISGKKINPLIGSAGVSAVPMAARVSQKEGQKTDPSNFLLMHAMGPNVAGVIGSAVAAGVLLSILG
ncbi:MAG: sodium ion-translocating decarboxylase subunit beta [Oscillospiraceae bacterium]|nr:sodium ion-translocating decarboxylase subunit beta [Oscillospiraceae bacterium]